MKFNYKEIVGEDGKLYLRITAEYDQRTWSEDTRLYWRGWCWGKPAAELRLCKRILNEIA